MKQSNPRDSILTANGVELYDWLDRKFRFTPEAATEFLEFLIERVEQLHGVDYIGPRPGEEE